MRLIRVAVFAIASLLMGGGYLMSQSAYLASLDRETADATAKYAAAVDTPAVKAVSLVLLLACVVLAALPQEADKE